MLSRSISLWKKKPPPLGYSKKDFFSKLNSPRASKPWRNRGVTSAGNIEVFSSIDKQTSQGDTVMGSLTTAAPLGLRSPHVPPFVAHHSQLSSQQSSSHANMEPMASLPGSSTAVEGAMVPSSSSSPASPYSINAGGAQHIIPATRGEMEAPPPPLTTLSFGNSLDLQVDGVRTHSEGPVPIHLQHHKRSRREVADSVMLPRHINALFHKIMGWSEELVDMEEDKKLSQGNSGDAEDGGDASSSMPTPLLRKKMSNLTDKMKYGVLLDAYEKDTFAMEQQLQVVGSKLERKFLEWEGVHILDQDATQEMNNVRENKVAMVLETPSSFKVPMVNQDCCSGCGALLQDTKEDELGYVAKGEVERYVLDRQRKVQARNEYAQRMAELQAHWEKHGRQVGEEWLDFMTQEEFDAFYRDKPTPFVCHRCHALENLGVTGRRKIWSAPDFTEKLRALKEKRCVIVLVIDITDFPGSMVYDLPGLVSMNNPVIIVANKMDCVRNRSFQYDGKDRAVAACLVSERYVRRWVLDIATQFGLPRHLVRDVIPVSAKRGWNVDKLIASIEDTANLNLRAPHKPLPTYFVGVANAGKSSLINAIAHKLYVPQPPHPESKKVYYTKTDAATGKDIVLWRWYTPPNVNQAEMLDIPARHDKKASKLLTVSSLPGTTVSANAVRISLVKNKSGDKAAEEDALLFDTPGLLPHWHRTSPLTLLQMRRTLIRKFRNAQCFILLPGHTLFLSGLAAVDIVKGPPRGMLLMVYSSQKVRHAIINTERSDAFWAEELGKALEPPGSLEQLADSTGTYPHLSESKTYLFECYNKHRRRPKADIYVCGVGWVSFCVSEPADVVLRVRTLSGVIHGVREPLRYNDLRAFRFWPKLKRRFTSKSIDDKELEVDADSISTVVRLTSGPVSTQESQEEKGEGRKDAGEGPVLRTVHKAKHPRYESASSSPLESLVEELESCGRPLSNP